MNKNSRGSFDQRIGPRAPHRNNINIQINFNVKDKNQGFVGKKIDNFVQVQQKNSKGELLTKGGDDNKKNKKKQTAQKAQKQKYLETPVKHKNFERSKANKNSEEKTPQRKSNEKREQRSKSTNQKLVKRKAAKSMQNIKTGIRYTRNKDGSPSSSVDKSRSNSKSSKKLLRNSDQSLKNLYMFTNSGIKNKLNKQKISHSRERQISVVSKKVTKDQDLDKPRKYDNDKLKKYMQQKKKKTKIEKTKQLKNQKIKKQKVMEELKRVEAERKANAGKPLPFSKKQLAPKQQKLPIYCFEDEEFDQSNQYQILNKQASEIIHQSPTPSNVMNSIPMNSMKNKERHENSSSSKLRKAKKDCLVHKYLNHTITSKQFQQLERNVTKIQSFWRGYVCRRQFMKKLNDQAIRFRYIKNKIETKRATFWNDEQNSIVNVQKDSGTIKVYDSGNSSVHYINFNSNNINSQISNNEYRFVEDQKEKTDKFKKLCINIDDQTSLQRQISKDKSGEQTFQNSKMLKQIEQLRKMLEKQTQKYKSLEQENQNLKANIKVLSLKQSREISQEKSEDLINSKDFIQIRMPKKIQSPINKNPTLKIKNISNIKDQDRQLKVAEQEKNAAALNSFKMQFQTFECSSPSNARLQEQLKQLKNKNIENIFLKKEIKIDQKYAKKREMFDRMLNEKIVSPRTYNIKKKQLQLKLKDEKEEVKKRIDEAKRVVGFIEDVESSEQDIRTAHTGQRIQPTKDNLKIEPSFKKQKNLQDSCTNTSPFQAKQITFKNNLARIKKDERSQSEYSSDSQKIYRKYWTDDIEEVHKHTLEITRKIEEAMKAESQQSSNKAKELFVGGSEGYNSNQFHSVQSSNQQSHSQSQNAKHEKSKSQGVNLQSLKESYQSYLQEVPVMPIQSEKKAREIFNKIDLSEEKECKSEDQLQNSHDNICNLLNQRPLHTSPNNSQNKPLSNLYISEAEFNKKKKKHEQDLSRSSSFQKSNKSLSINNNSQLQYKGFITNLTFIKQFCISMCEFIRNNDHYREMFVQNISQSIKYDKFGYLRAYRVTISGEVKNNYNNFQDQYVYPYFKYISQKKIALSSELFNDFIKVYDEQKSKDLTWNDPAMNKNTKEMRSFFLQNIKDNFNESLEYQKPGSIYGEPMPWLHHSKHLKNHINVNLRDLNNIQKRYSSDSSDFEQQNQEEKRLDQIFGSSIAKIIQWGSCLCGFIADPMPMEMGDSQIANLSDQQLNSIRQNRVGLMLEKWLLEEEELMTNSTMQYTEVLLFLGQKIINQLILQCAEEVQEILEP